MEVAVVREESMVPEKAAAAWVEVKKELVVLVGSEVE